MSAQPISSPASPSGVGTPAARGSESLIRIGPPGPSIHGDRSDEIRELVDGLLPAIAVDDRIHNLFATTGVDYFLERLLTKWLQGGEPGTPPEERAPASPAERRLIGLAAAAVEALLDDLHDAMIADGTPYCRQREIFAAVLGRRRACCCTSSP